MTPALHLLSLVIRTLASEISPARCLAIKSKVNGALMESYSLLGLKVIFFFLNLIN